MLEVRKLGHEIYAPYGHWSTQSQLSIYHPLLHGLNGKLTS